jgi:hypothetical protein
MIGNTQIDRKYEEVQGTILQHSHGDFIGKFGGGTYLSKKSMKAWETTKWEKMLGYTLEIHFGSREFATFLFKNQNGRDCIRANEPHFNHATCMYIWD